MATKSKKLYRSRDDRWIAGVCGGIAKYLGIDSLWVRIAFAVLVHASLFFYILAWIFIPEEPTE